jgi:5-methylthioadenosine/S-adenosylhomocysteine deaminase
MHVAESAEESALVMEGTGGFATRWRERGIETAARGVTPVAWLDRHGVLGPDALCIHCVRVTDPDLDLLAARGAAVAHCPRSNRRHGHGDAPLARIRAAGIRVGAGTDSVASVAPLDLLAEARLARELGGLSPWETIDLVTRGAAEAIGLGAEAGVIARGRWADFAVFALPPRLDGRRLPDTLASLATNDVICTMLSGREVWRHG